MQVVSSNVGALGFSGRRENVARAGKPSSRRVVKVLCHQRTPMQRMVGSIAGVSAGVSLLWSVWKDQFRPQTATAIPNTLTHLPCRSCLRCKSCLARPWPCQPPSLSLKASCRRQRSCTSSSGRGPAESCPPSHPRPTPRCAGHLGWHMGRAGHMGWHNGGTMAHGRAGRVCLIT